MRRAGPRNTVAVGNGLLGVSAVLNVVLVGLLMLAWTKSSQPHKGDVVMVSSGGKKAMDDDVDSFLKNHDTPKNVISDGCHDWINGKSFLQAAKRSPVPSDKTTITFDIHSYETIYERYLGPFKCFSEHQNGKKMKLFEIGIGPDGELRSYRLYKEFLGNKMDYYSLEYTNQTDLILKNTKFTAHEKQYLLTNMVIGDQSSAESLQKVKDQWAPFDVIVDDGSHVNRHQIFSFQHLFLDALAPGGVYIIEDLQTSFHRNWQGGLDVQKKHKTAVQMLTNMMKALHFHWWNHPRYNSDVKENSYGQEVDESFTVDEKIMEWVQTIDCDREICAIRKRTQKLKRRRVARM